MRTKKVLIFFKKIVDNLIFPWYNVITKRKGDKKMTYCNGFWVMTSKQYDEWRVQYEEIMNDPNSSDELLQMTEQFNDAIAIED